MSEYVIRVLIADDQLLMRTVGLLTQHPTGNRRGGHGRKRTGGDCAIVADLLPDVVLMDACRGDGRHQGHGRDLTADFRR
ncbi:MAG: hypothetical protein IPH82_29785 [Chloroflexi bacterium]|nr:hypothetical protein [Chloroflexota bacterium]